jgi:16S rRNA (adenine1518-N6/adenine1519-N6)-dimethyltransferase
MNKKRCTELIKEYIILPAHSLGQNFLVDDSAADFIVESAGILSEDDVIEIGPGLGALTEKLAGKAAEVHAIEIDSHLLDALNETVGLKNNVHVICSDFLKISKKNLRLNKTNQFIIVSNIPYYVMTPIMMKLFREWDDAKAMVFTVEDATCDRIFAEPGSKHYGPLSIISSLYGKKEKLLLLDSHSFHPAPHTKSAVIRLTSYGILQEAPTVLFPLVVAAFSQRRKTLINSLSSSGLFPDGKKQVKDLLLSLSIKPTIRAEELYPQDYIRIARELVLKSTEIADK